VREHNLYVLAAHSEYVLQHHAAEAVRDRRADLAARRRAHNLENRIAGHSAPARSGPRTVFGAIARIFSDALPAGASGDSSLSVG